MVRGTIRLACCFGFAMLLCGNLLAGVITDLNNTGVSVSDHIDDNWGVTLGVSTAGDPCGGADLCESPNAYVPMDQAMIVPVGFNQTWYTGGPSISQWIAPGVRADYTQEETSPGAGDNLDFGEATYIYSTNFYITGNEPFPGASISGLWWADGRLNWSGSGKSDGLNLGNCSIYVNNTCAYDVQGGFEDAWASSTGNPFKLTAGFVLGENTVRFIVLNGFNETGLRVSFTDRIVFPEPATYALIGTGLAAVALLRRRRKT